MTPEGPGTQTGSVARRLLDKLGPGLVTGASDDDPSGIATYSQVGAQFGYGLLWTILLSYPLMAAIQEISARIGRVTGCGIAANLRKTCPKPLLYAVLAAMAGANVFNLGADIGAMGTATELLLPFKAGFFTIVFGAASLASVLFIPYLKYTKYLKWLTLSLFAYVGVICFVHLQWRVVLLATIFPQFHRSNDYVTAVVAVFGTTISPYLFFWQASQEVEEIQNNRGEKALRRAPIQAQRHLKRIRIDTYLGMALSNIIAFFIILTAASSLHVQGITNVQTAAEAARALEPIAGRFASALFACGIVGTGLLAVPVLAASAAYGVGEAGRWQVSLQRTPAQAGRFYSAICVSTLIGLALNFLHINPIRALFWAAVLNGLAAAPLMTVIMIMASSRKVMGKFVISFCLKAVGWVGAGVMACICLAMLLTS